MHQVNKDKPAYTVRKILKKKRGGRGEIIEHSKKQFCCFLELQEQKTCWYSRVIGQCETGNGLEINLFSSCFSSLFQRE